MHELSIALSIVEMAQEESERRGQAQVLAVHLRLGQLSGVVKEALLSSYEMACQATPLEGSQLLIEEIPVDVFCPKCQMHAAGSLDPVVLLSEVFHTDSRGSSRQRVGSRSAGD